MDRKKILSHIDHTMLMAFSTWEDIQKVCQDAIEYNTASICIPPSYVKRVKETYGNKINICTVVGFPLGYSTTSVKVLETKEAIENGASEIDMVINIGDIKNCNFENVYHEISTIREAARGFTLKVIIETCYLTEKEKIKLCEIITQANADFIKTSTGFGTNGATVEDIILFKEHIGQNVKIKAAGGVKTIHDLELFIENGCDRIGTSSAVKILSGQESDSY